MLLSTEVEVEFDISTSICCSKCGKSLNIVTEDETQMRGTIVLDYSIEPCECSSNDELVEEIKRLKSEIKFLQFGS